MAKHRLDEDSTVFLPPPYMISLQDRVRHMVDDMVWTAMEANGEDASDLQLFALRKSQVTIGAEKPCDRVDPDPHALEAYAERMTQRFSAAEAEGAKPLAQGIIVNPA